jgi:GNAT superfamily N-acetyltransferase
MKADHQIRTRLACEADEDVLLELGRMATAECFPQYAFSDERARETIRSGSGEAAGPRFFFVAEHLGEIVGFSIVHYLPMPFADGFSTDQRVIYVRPDKRSTRAAAELVRYFKRWTASLDHVESIIELASDRRSAATARFVGRFGYRVIGHVLRKEG